MDGHSLNIQLENYKNKRSLRGLAIINLKCNLVKATISSLVMVNTHAVVISKVKL